eukprot:TRINITY_DN11281_c0_g1_i1.p1 TRINITY_DN11281_c0_g1~~TRINITY_DN11281_c0_g1_i1.p1  ORF type:complete len:586 (+),score=72.77 TRINITY_DN11281_c0_g1_i1:64-1821(+)
MCIRDRYITARDRRLDKFLESYKEKLAESKIEKIISASASELLTQLRGGSLTSEEIVIAYGIRLATIGRRLNNIADIDLEQSLELARKKDLERKNCKNPNELPPLHGLPISIKDHLNTKGFREIIGYSSRVRNPPTDINCDVIEILRNRGAIPLTKSNVPFGLNAMESTNRVFGATKNPFDASRSCGGSSGGEGGLLASRCSPLGVGTDMAGSLRLPAAYCGIYSFMPTMKRHSVKGVLWNDGELVRYKAPRDLSCHLGPMARNVDDLILLLREYLGIVGRDPTVVEMRWNQNLYEGFKGRKNLKIAYVIEDEFCETAPAIKNAMMEVIATLRKLGYSVQEFPKMRSFQRQLKLVVDILAARGPNVSIDRSRKGEIPPECQWGPYLIGLMPLWLQKCCRWLAGCFGEKRIHYVFSAFYKKSLEEYCEILQQKELIKEEFFETWCDGEFDVFIGPVMPCVAVPLGVAKEVGLIIQHTALFNVLEWCGGCVPIRAVKEDEQYYESRYKDFVTSGLTKVMKNAKGLPITVQVMAPAFKDEMAMAVLKNLEDAFSYHPYDSLRLQKESGREGRERCTINCGCLMFEGEY